jgi:hypothetical protein
MENELTGLWIFTKFYVMDEYMRNRYLINEFNINPLKYISVYDDNDIEVYQLLNLIL